MRSNARFSAMVLVLVSALLLGGGSLLLGGEGQAAGPPGGIDVEVINGPGNPVPVVGQVTGEVTGTVQCEQSGDWSVGCEQVGEWTVQKGTRQRAFREVNLTGDTPNQSFDVDVSGSTKVRIALTVNGSSGEVNVSLTSKLQGANFGSFLDFFETSNSAGDRTRVYELPGEELGIRISQDDGFHQVFVTIWGD